ncbi:MAG: hypothetical protein GY953_13205 [bacterium]|nr:hypothetical protein [bacterium]
MIRCTLLITIVSGLLAVSATAQTTIYVNGSCGDDSWTGLRPDCVAPDGPKATIQAGINAAVKGDEVVVADGTYTGPDNKNLDYGGKAITVRSLDPEDPAVVAATIIDCGGSQAEPNRGVAFRNGEGPASVLAGITIINGYAPIESIDVAWSAGGAIYCYFVRLQPSAVIGLGRGGSLPVWM